MPSRPSLPTVGGVSHQDPRSLRSRRLTPVPVHLKSWPDFNKNLFAGDRGACRKGLEQSGTSRETGTVTGSQESYTSPSTTPVTRDQRLREKQDQTGS